MFDSFTQPAAMEAPSHTLERRYCYGGYDRYGNCYRRSRWSDWGRWVLLGVIIFIFLVIFFLFSCVGARRRRKQGARPMYGTGWLAPQQPGYYGPGGSNDNNNNYQQPAPQYGAANSYYGQANNVEMQAPQQTYQQPQGGYAPPPGAPPGKY